MTNENTNQTKIKDRFEPAVPQMDYTWLTNLTPEEVIKGLELYAYLAYMMDILTPTAKRRAEEVLKSLKIATDRLKLNKMIDEAKLKLAKAYPPVEAE